MLNTKCLPNKMTTFWFPGQLFGAFVKLFLEPTNTFTIGFDLTFPNMETIHVWLVIELVIQDMAAHKYVYSCVGSSGNKFCCECLNIRASKSLTHNGDGEQLLVSSVIKTNQLHLARDSDLHEAVDILASF